MFPFSAPGWEAVPMDQIQRPVGLMWMWFRAGAGAQETGVLLGLGVPIMLLGLLPPSTDCSPHPPPGFASYEVVVPRKFASKEGNAVKDEMSYVIKVEGRNHIVHLKQKKGFIVKNLPVYTYNPQGRLLVDHPSIPEDCYYHGYVEDSPESLAVLSTCSGLRGLLRIGSLQYAIEPVKSSLIFQHLLYRIGEAGPEPAVCELTDREMEKQTAEVMEAKKQASKKPFVWGQTKYLEFLVVVDKQRYVHADKNMTNVVLSVIEVVNLADEFFSSLRLRILLTALEVWTDDNPIKITKNVAEVLHNFNIWRKAQPLARVPHDVGHLFSFNDFGKDQQDKLTAKSYHYSACDQSRASAVVSFIDSPVKNFALLVAHLLGHQVGMVHDGQACACGNSSFCIMDPARREVYQFSNCSERYYLNFMRQGKGNCLNNLPETGVFFLMRRCGNQIVEEGEECDCGSEKQCRKDPCCDHTCKRKEGTTCNVGKCCKNCQLLVEGAICRDTVDECDLPEYCNGTSPYCPEDTHIQDGTVCGGDGYCFHGKCNSHNIQCEKLFGKPAKAAPISCFREANMKGDRFGNCWDGGENKTFEKCKPENVLCGRLQCVDVKMLPWLEEHVTIIQTLVSNIWCWGTDHYSSAESADYGLIEDGATCAADKICYNQTCFNHSVLLQFSCSPSSMCNGRGVCNNNGNCHCKDGWAPPFCQFPGFGGSRDSGPPPVSKIGILNLIMLIVGIVLGATAIIVIFAILIVRRAAVTQAVSRTVQNIRSRTLFSPSDSRSPQKDDTV
ncbi:PREDICTED: disintegrin and metalloproteinase domain-containing protein 21-like [Crocodylus porosus]|uniref:disintegrin and metalloproteinase domain-containing protein 21-like n=1 Tax=Crocodylus porosus TaxID=8502 RepID=UPI00093A6192|nr:PREDICTED: disintegrin and metalloproteinase domain-containing protein 21-like [Crocodylus porosus]